MALRIYHDANGTQEITSTNPDTAHQAVPSGQTLTHDKAIYIKSDDANLTYENILIDALGDTDGATQSGQVDVLYAPDVNGAPGAFSQTLTLPNGTYQTAYKIWRRVVAPNVTGAFRITTINHQLTWDEYVV